MISQRNEGKSAAIVLLTVLIVAVNATTAVLIFRYCNGNNNQIEETAQDTKTKQCTGTTVPLPEPALADMPDHIRISSEKGWLVFSPEDDEYSKLLRINEDRFIKDNPFKDAENIELEKADVTYVEYLFDEIINMSYESESGENGTYTDRIIFPLTGGLKDYVIFDFEQSLVSLGCVLKDGNELQETVESILAAAYDK